MDVDIVLSQETKPVKNGTVVLGFYNQTKNTYVSNKPSIDEIQYKYSNKWTSIHYYTGGSSFDGGTYVGEINGGNA